MAVLEPRYPRYKTSLDLSIFKILIFLEIEVSYLYFAGMTFQNSTSDMNNLLVFYAYLHELPLFMCKWLWL